MMPAVRYCAGYVLAYKLMHQFIDACVVICIWFLYFPVLLNSLNTTVGLESLSGQTSLLEES